MIVLHMLHTHVILFYPYRQCQSNSLQTFFLSDEDGDILPPKCLK